MTSRAVLRWQKLSAKVLAVTRILSLTSVMYRHPLRKNERDFVVIEAADWVNVLALTPTLELVLVKQFRFGIDAISLEIPGGVVERGEDPLAAALRELKEETGYSGTGGKVIGVVHPNPAIQSNRCHVVLVENVVNSGQVQWDPDEEIEVLKVPVESVYACAAKGEITHSLVLDALLLFMPRWTEIKAEHFPPFDLAKRSR